MISCILDEMINIIYQPQWYVCAYVIDMYD